ncbi:hypothetical protein ATE68_15375 [Sphingopyxis sp. H038]|jgi:hypothetical protein|nr:hypothetical protein ATE78_17135 [Sphingopyxis sp. H012]KTE33334.1 hypothetical protein ATE68_15375 [Sphingopyxis sp. H038]KTE47472.1 hypothetical protein ATE73_07680 [Sphingopyxis sp. H077]
MFSRCLGVSTPLENEASMLRRSGLDRVEDGWWGVRVPRAAIERIAEAGGLIGLTEDRQVGAGHVVRVEYCLL